MTNPIQAFDYQGKSVRTHVDPAGVVWFVAKDLCDILEIINPSDAVKALDDDERMTLAISDSHSGQRGGARSITLVTESGLYALVFRSRKAEARALSKHVRSVILPAINKTGVYVAPGAQLQVAGPAKVQDAFAALTAAIQEDAEEKAAAKYAHLEGLVEGVEQVLASERTNAEREKLIIIGEMEKLGKTLIGVAGKARSGTLNDSGPPEWSGPKISVPLPFDDVLLGLGFKTKREGDAFIDSVMSWLDNTKERDPSTKQMELPHLRKPSSEPLIRGYMVAGDGGMPLVTAQGRGVLDARLAYNRHRFDLRPVGEWLGIRNMLAGRRAAGELPELRAAYEQNRAPSTPNFSGPSAKQIAAE